MEKLLGHREEVARRLKELGLLYITLDLEGFRSGSMDVGMDAGMDIRCFLSGVGGQEDAPSELLQYGNSE